MVQPGTSARWATWTSGLKPRSHHVNSTELESAEWAAGCEQSYWNTYSELSGWRRGVVVSGVRRMNEVNARRARLVFGWVTVFGWVYHLGMQQAN